ncbi:chromatin modification-related protein eaf-1-like [Amphibalanus amphitrite]|uniref:chromatin modification-related protein eaf-1-like n=1 Tax=Amphibalanus amphitrite TaxID=1232801 RepID=UPI001C929834|nr:chromatin modification-related protein eaf-1-like [Amphibalanus amphitrite]XP_043225372.1 chromatin modification-related protein eaf-1-like [Amphibalanus amphitrite]
MMMAARLPASFQEQVVIQGGYKDDTKGLWSEIWNTLMGYINADDSPNKLQQKELLVDLMSQFLSRVAHDSKFYLTCTSTVLRASLEQANCRPLTAAQAFEALHEYAIRILAQPWRAEFTKINMYSGYYVHTVQSRLLEAHRLLEEMGFRVDVTSQTATLREPVDVDQVTKAAIDTLMASVECRIIERILESLPAGAYTPLGVLCYRSSYVGGVEAAVHHLNVTLRQRNFQRYFAPPTEVSGGGGGGGGAAPPVYPWHPAPAAAPTALPPVPTARLVDVGEREPRDNQGWIPKTIRHQPAERSEQRSPAPAALLPATLDEHQLASWDLVGDAATTATAGTSPQVRQPPSYDSLDDSWGYVLNSLDRRRPVSGRYDNVPELDEADGQRGASFQRSATLPTPRSEPRAPPRGGRGYVAAGQERQTYDQQPKQAPLSNGSARPPATETRNGMGPESSAVTRQQQHYHQQQQHQQHHNEPQQQHYHHQQQQQYQQQPQQQHYQQQPQHPQQHQQYQQQQHHQHHSQQQQQYNQQPQQQYKQQQQSQQHRQHQVPAGSDRAGSTMDSAPPRPPPPTEVSAAPQRPPTYEYSDSVRAAALAEHDPAPRGSLPSEYGGVEHNPAPRPSLPADYHQVAAQQVSQKTHQTARQTPQQTPHVQASHSLPRDVHPNSRGSPANDNLMPRSSSLVSDHSKTPRPAAGEQGTAPRSAGGGRGNGAGDSGNSRRPSSQRPSPRPEPSPEPAARPRASPSEPRRPELGAWPTRPEPTAAAPADEQWSCHACTYLNPVSVRVCSMCGKTRQTGSRPAPVAPVAAPPVDPPDDLACPKCTLLNSRRARKCGACEAELQPAK